MTTNGSSASAKDAMSEKDRAQQIAAVTARLEPIIQRLEKHQASLELSDSQFVARYQETLRSTKTWKQRICARDFSDSNLVRIEKKLQELVSKIDGGSAITEEFFKEMPFAQQMETIVTMLRAQATDRRNVYALTTTGIGKSVFARSFVRQNPQDSAYVRMNGGCRNRPKQIILALSEAIGMKREITDSRLFASLIDRLQAEPLTIFIDEAHEGGYLLMQVVKTLIDETPARFVQLCYPTEFDRVKSSTAGSLDEAKQLIGRTIKPIFDNYRDGLHVPDVECYLKCSGLDEESARDVAELILPMVRANGNLRVLADAVASARLVCSEQDREIDAATLRRAVQAQCPRRAN